MYLCVNDSYACWSVITLDITMMLSLEATLTTQTAASGRLANTNYLCQSCRLHWLNRPRSDALTTLIGAWNNLHVCLPAGKALIWLTDRISSWQAKARCELVISGEQSSKNKNTGRLYAVLKFVLLSTTTFCYVKHSKDVTPFPG